MAGPSGQLHPLCTCTAGQVVPAGGPSRRAHLALQAGRLPTEAVQLLGDVAHSLGHLGAKLLCGRQLCSGRTAGSICAELSCKLAVCGSPAACCGAGLQRACKRRRARSRTQCVTGWRRPDAAAAHPPSCIALPSSWLSRCLAACRIASSWLSFCRQHEGRARHGTSTRAPQQGARAHDDWGAGLAVPSRQTGHPPRAGAHAETGKLTEGWQHTWHACLAGRWGGTHLPRLLHPDAQTGRPFSRAGQLVSLLQRPASSGPGGGRMAGVVEGRQQWAGRANHQAQQARTDPAGCAPIGVRPTCGKGRPAGPSSLAPARQTCRRARKRRGGLPPLRRATREPRKAPHCAALSAAHQQAAARWRGPWPPGATFVDARRRRPAVRGVGRILGYNRIWRQRLVDIGVRLPTCLWPAAPAWQPAQPPSAAPTPACRSASLVSLGGSQAAGGARTADVQSGQKLCPAAPVCACMQQAALRVVPSAAQHTGGTPEAPVRRLARLCTPRLRRATRLRTAGQPDLRAASLAGPLFAAHTDAPAAAGPAP